MNCDVKLKKLKFFPKVSVKVTGKCNFCCPFCCEPSRDQYEPSFDELSKLSRRLNELGVRRLSITGGEPLLYPDLDKFLQLNRSYGIYNFLLTADPFSFEKRMNAILPFVDAVRFSIHGVGGQHDCVVGRKNTFRKNSEIINKIVSHGVSVAVACVVTNKNIRSLNGIASWCVDNSISKLYLFRLLESGLGKGFVEQNGGPSVYEFNREFLKLKSEFESQKITIYNYDFSTVPQCIIVYGDGRIICEPKAGFPNSQKEIGNIFFDSAQVMWKRFSEDGDVSVYWNHLEKSLY